MCKDGEKKISRKVRLNLDGEGNILQPATTPTTLLPGGVGGDGGAVLDPANLHASSGQGSQSGLGAGSGGLGPVAAGGTQLDVQGGDAKSLKKGSC